MCWSLTFVITATIFKICLNIECRQFYTFLVMLDSNNTGIIKISTATKLLIKVVC